MAAFSEINPRHARAEAAALGHAIINRARDNSHTYGYKNTGNLDNDISGQVLSPNQVQGVGNKQWTKLQDLFDGKTALFNAGDLAKLNGAIQGVEDAYAHRDDDRTGSVSWDHPPSPAGSGLSEKYCAPAVTDTVGTMVRAKCTK